jgi:hypothetical protein
MTTIFQQAAPYRRHLLALFVTLCGVDLIGSNFYITKDVRPGALSPDFAPGGYTPQEAIDWYDAIEEGGRRLYAYLWYPLELVIMITYAILLSNQLSMSFSCPSFLPCIPVPST